MHGCFEIMRGNYGNKFHCLENRKVNSVRKCVEDGFDFPSHQTNTIATI